MKMGVASAVYDSSLNFVSSIIMSLNSLDSKISPHSLHSTYSESSSRDTICTRGCLHGGLGSFAGADGGEMGVINPVYERPCPGGKGKTPEIGRILSLSEAVVNSLPHKVIFHSIALFIPWAA